LQFIVSFCCAETSKQKGEVLLLCYLSEFTLFDSSGKEEIGIEEYSFSQSTLEQVEFCSLLIIYFFLSLLQKYSYDKKSEELGYFVHFPVFP